MNNQLSEEFDTAGALRCNQLECSQLKLGHLTSSIHCKAPSRMSRRMKTLHVSLSSSLTHR